MNLYDIVEVVADREEYKNQGIVKGMRGRVIDIIQEKPGWRAIYFINPRECQEKCVSFWVRLNFHTSALGFGTWN